MKNWAPVDRDLLCGLCGRHIAEGTTALRVVLRNVKRERWRCADCVGEAPPNLPAIVKRMWTAPAMTPLRAIKVREPGQEG